jgi:hypothetical protein
MESQNVEDDKIIHEKLLRNKDYELSILEKEEILDVDITKNVLFATNDINIFDFYPNLYYEGKSYNGRNF